MELCHAQASVDAGNQAKTFGLLSTIGFGAGLAGLGTAAILLLTEPPAPKHASLRAPAPIAKPRIAVSAAPLPDPRDSALLQIHGAW